MDPEIERLDDVMISMRQSSWYYLQAVESAATLRDLEVLLTMLAEEIASLRKQIKNHGLDPMKGAMPTGTVDDKAEARALGYALAAYMQDLRNHIREMTQDGIWPAYVYDKTVVWPEEQGRVQQAILPGMETATGHEAFPKPCELPVLRVIDGRKAE
ncbi:MAG: hypothetical protein AAGA45_07595 [Verrucomicrobiota bacterium]